MADCTRPNLNSATVIESVASDLNADIVFYSGGIDAPANRMLDMMMGRTHQHPKVMFFLTTDGGSADIACQITRCLQNNYKHGKYIIFVHAFCKIAGTLIAAGANELVMSDGAELGPLDVQVRKRDELGERISGLTPIQALSTLRHEAFRTFEQYLVKIRVSSRFQITTMSAAQIAAKLTNGCFAPIYRQIDPMGLGEHQRAMMIASDYGERLNKGILKPNVLERLITGYPSHESVIDRTEACELFHTVREPSPMELLMAHVLQPEVDEGMSEPTPIIRFLSSEVKTGGYNGDGGSNGPEDVEDKQISPPTGREGGEAVGQDGSQRTDGSGLVPETDTASGDLAVHRR